MRGETAVITLMSIYYVTGLWLVNLEFALPIGLITGILVFVPYLGTITGLALATFAAITQFQDWSSVITVWVVVGSGQLLEGMLITPGWWGTYWLASGGGDLFLAGFWSAVWFYRDIAGIAD